MGFGIYLLCVSLGLMVIAICGEYWPVGVGLLIACFLFGADNIMMGWLIFVLTLPLIMGANNLLCWLTHRPRSKPRLLRSGNASTSRRTSNTRHSSVATP